MSSYPRHAPGTPHPCVERTGLAWQSDPLKCTICFAELPATYLLTACDHLLCVSHEEDAEDLPHRCPACRKPLAPGGVVKHTRPFFRSDGEIEAFARGLLPEEGLKLAFYANEFHVKQKSIEVLLEQKKARRFVKSEAKAKQHSKELENELNFVRSECSKHHTELEELRAAKREVDHRLLDLGSRYKSLQRQQLGGRASAEASAHETRPGQLESRDGQGGGVNGWEHERIDYGAAHGSGGSQLMARNSSPMYRGIGPGFPRHSPRGSPHEQRAPFARRNEPGSLPRAADGVVPGLLNSAASPVTPHQLANTKRASGRNVPSCGPGGVMDADELRKRARGMPPSAAAGMAALNSPSAQRGQAQAASRQASFPSCMQRAQIGSMTPTRDRCGNAGATGGSFMMGAPRYQQHPY